ncbi:MAG: XRE family transcriptional regulator [Clostridia bacterium]|nr:XRE family transcriptional regulator [Clostridia bacterium]
MEIGNKIKRMRLRLGLTQEELAARTELTKGFISQLERDITSPSIATLMDILEALGSDVGSFFNEKTQEKVVYKQEDMFVKEDTEQGCTVCWLVTNAQKNELEPILVTLSAGGHTNEDDPHEGEEFGYVLSGTVILIDGDRRFRIKKGDGFYFHPSGVHYLQNGGKSEAKVLWVCTPPSF